MKYYYAGVGARVGLRLEKRWKGRVRIANNINGHSNES